VRGEHRDFDAVRAPRLRALFASSLAFVTSLLGGGCASDAGEGTIVDRKTTSIAPLTESLDAMRRGASPGSLSDNGLEVRAWLVGDDAALVGKALTDLGAAAPIDDRLQASLAANGMRLYRLPVRDLPALQDAVGPVSHDRQESFGQVFDWRELFTRSLKGATRGVAIDGRVRSLPGGAVSLLVRAWTMKTEEGPRVQFEMVPYYLEANTSLRQILNPEPQEPLLGERPEPGEVFRSVVVRMGLEDGWAYVLTCEAPEIDWRNVRQRGAARPSNQEASNPSGDGAVRGTIGPSDFGPESAGPATLGELLMRGEEGSGVRLMLILVPHIPSALFPPSMPE